jgi:hypothetical protein
VAVSRNPSGRPLGGLKKSTFNGAACKTQLKA